MNMIFTVAALWSLSGVQAWADPECPTPFMWWNGLPGEDTRGTIEGAMWVGAEDAGRDTAFTVYGNLSRVGGVAGRGLFQFRDRRWHAWPVPIQGIIKGAVIFDLDGPGPQPASLVVGGRFTGSPRYIARWTGSAWEQLTTAGIGTISTFKVLDEDGPGPLEPTMFAATSTGVAKWVNGAWEVRPLESQSPEWVLTADLDGAGEGPTRLFVAGISRIGWWNGDHWEYLEPPNSQIYHIALYDRDGDGPGPGAILVATEAGVFVYEQDLRPRLITETTPGVAIVRVASFDDGAGLAGFALVRLGLQGPFEIWRSQTLEAFQPMPQMRFSIPDYTVGIFEPISLRSPTDCARLASRAESFGGPLVTYGPMPTYNCRADFNVDGFADFYDYSDFVEAFESGDPRADFNFDRFVDWFDYDAFVRVFEEGC